MPQARNPKGLVLRASGAGLTCENEGHFYGEAIHPPR